jgi:ADP-ribose pyrophosphatase YjhB (NUDIX family)
MAAGLLVRDPGGSVLLVKPTYKDGWDIPGGYVEEGESPAAACSRELAEELGLHGEIGRLLVVDWAPHPQEGDKVLFIFDGGTMPPTDAMALSPDGDEIGEVRFWPLDALDRLTPARLARRLRLAVDASANGWTTYAEHGTSTVHSAA